ncbi:MAG TPA: nucleotidyltransferase family protein [Stellaceae bacterium]|nr:nucleotidyltransferase family protein [Stellaceae bacterium]
MLETVRALGLPDCWIGAGFVRNAVWDRLHGFSSPTPLDDIDVVWFDPARAEKSVDEALLTSLRARRPDLPWSVKNQARMHLRNGDRPYRSSQDAMRHWPETATAVALRLHDDDVVELAAPLGVDDLLALVLRPTPHFRAHRLSAYLERHRAKNWCARWPRLHEL